MKKTIFALMMVLLLTGAEKINWSMLDVLDWKFASDAKAVEAVPAKAPAKAITEQKQPVKFAPVPEYYQAPLEIIYTQPRITRFYRYPEYIWKSCK